MAGAEEMTRTAVTMKTGSSAMLFVLMLHHARSGIMTAGNVLALGELSR
jgi:hypothetical protein